MAWTAIAALASLFGISVLWRTAVPLYFSTLRLLHGPPCPNIFYGHMRQALKAGNSRLNREWIQQYGSNIGCRWLLMIPSLWTADPRTIDHILHSNKYVKPWEARVSAGRIIGDSVLVAEGEAHRKQRRVLNPAFGSAQIRELGSVFLEKSAQLGDVWEADISREGGCARINVLEGLKKMTLDVIGLAGFDYDLEALSAQGKSNELNQAFYQIFGVTPPLSIFRILMDIFPALDFFPDERTRTVNAAQAVMRRIGLELIRNKKAAVTQELYGSGKNVETKDVQGKDLLSLLIKANMATDIPDNQRLSEQEILSQIPTLLVAGHETTSTAGAWCLYALTQAPRVQQKLRQELFLLHTGSPSVDDLHSLPYLDHFIRETLRVYAPVSFVIRSASEDDVVPISQPFVDRNGISQSSLRITKGNRIIISILSLHQSKEIWGDDALEFKPERWEHPPDAASSIPGVWGHTMTFSGGPRACIGFRFSIAELKALVFTLVRAFEFELAGSSEDITCVGMFTQRPALSSELDKGAQLPLLVRPYDRV